MKTILLSRRFESVQECCTWANRLVGNKVSEIDPEIDPEIDYGRHFVRRVVQFQIVAKGVLEWVAFEIIVLVEIVTWDDVPHEHITSSGADFDEVRTLQAKIAEAERIKQEA